MRRLGAVRVSLSYREANVTAGKSLTNSTFSRHSCSYCWKIARVAPIFKNGPADESCIYRPISVLPVVSRLFEKLIYDQLYQYLDSNKLVFEKQSAYRRMHSVLSCLLKCTSDWYLNLEGDKYTAATFVDLKKGFDTINHGIFLQKLDLYGIQDRGLKWFCSYLTKRRQCCKVNGKLSKIQSITCGVLQGSCLGPLLFIIYVNDLHLHMRHCEVNMFADHTSFMFASDSITQIDESQALYGYMETTLKALHAHIMYLPRGTLLSTLLHAKSREK